MSMRKIDVNGVEYEWKVGKKHVEIRGPNNFKRTPLKREATMGYFKAKDFDDGGTGYVTPVMIKLFIMRELNK